MKLLVAGLLCVPLVALGDQGPGALCPHPEGPVQAVESYLTAMQERRSEDAIDFVDADVTEGDRTGAWATQRRLFFHRSEMEIQGLETRPAVSSGDDRLCESIAIVPNILRSQDRLNFDGGIEFELYTVISNGSGWRIDDHETLYGDVAIRAWFPDIEIVDVSFTE